MSVLDVIKKRRSVRKYKDKDVAWGYIADMLEAGQYAPSAGNLENWKFVVIREEETISKIADACHEQEWIKEAPALIIVVGEPDKAEEFYGERGATFYTIQNCAAAIQNMMIVATDHGLGTCWVGAFDEDQLESILNLPEHAVVQGIITVGFADETPPVPVRKELQTLVFTKAWGDKGYGDKAKGYKSANILEAKEQIKKTVKRRKKRK